MSLFNLDCSCPLKRQTPYARLAARIGTTEDTEVVVRRLLVERASSDDPRTRTRSYISHTGGLSPLCTSESSVVSPPHAGVGREIEWTQRALSVDGHVENRENLNLLESLRGMELHHVPLLRFQERSRQR